MPGRVRGARTKWLSRWRRAWISGKMVSSHRHSRARMGLRSATILRMGK